MIGPGEYVPDVTEGISNLGICPAKVVRVQSELPQSALPALRQACPTPQSRQTHPA